MRLVKKWETYSCLWYLVGILCLTGKADAQVKKQSHLSGAGCDKLIFVESPYCDLSISKRYDTTCVGKTNSLEMRGHPAKKSLIPIIGYKVHHLDVNYVDKCFLKVYTVSKRKACKVNVFGMDTEIDENSTTWRNFSQSGVPLAETVLDQQDYLVFDVTNFVKKRLQQGVLTFYLQSDGKKVVDIASRESGLSAELIFEVCAVSPEDYRTLNHPGRKEEATMKILPNSLEGKLTVQLAGVPSGGFADLMIMDDSGNILQHVPLAIRDGVVLYHSVDFGELLPGHYWALFRKGRVMIRSEFMVAPSQRNDRLLEIQLVADNSGISSKD